MPSLADIEHEIENVLSVDDGTLFDAESAAVDTYLEELANAEAEKIDNFCRYIRMKAADAAAKREEAGRLMNSARSDENTVAFLKARYVAVMRKHGLQKIKGAAYKISMRASDVVSITNEDKLPPEFMRVKTSTEPDKAAIKAALKDGQEIPGAELAKSYSLQVA